MWRSPSLGVLRPIAVASFLLVTACAPAAQQSDSSPNSAIVRQGAQPASTGGGNFEAGPGQALQTGSSNQVQDKTLVIGIASEVRGFSPINGLQNKFVEDLLVGNLFLQDEQGRWFPALTSESPRLDNGTWKLFDDGTSETTYKIKRGVKWHDGVEFTVHDLIFFWKVMTDKDIPSNFDRAATIKNMEALDDYTLRTTWSIWEAEADAIELRIMWPVPRHILEEVYNTDKARFLNHPYWSSDFVGLGPYKLSRFERGSHLELTAHDDYILGKPKIKNVVVRFYQDTNVLISGLLSGDVQMTLHGSTQEGALAITDGILLGNRWGSTREGKVLFNSVRIALLAVQWNPDLQRPVALGDGRVRQALLYAVDRQTLVEQQFSGFTSVAEAWVPPDDPDYAMMAEGSPRYAYDPGRAQSLLADAGWQRGPDGMVTNPGGERLEIEYRASGTDAETTAQAVADYWKRVGVDTQLLFVPRARANDNEWLAKFPGVRNTNMRSAPVAGATFRFTCTRVPGERNAWLFQSSNSAGYCSPETQPWVDAMETTFPFNARMEPFREIERIALRELPYLPLFFEAEAVAVRSNVGGINRVPPKERGRIGMHAYIWTLE